jgi:hypothetical protein
MKKKKSQINNNPDTLNSILYNKKILKIGTPFVSFGGLEKSIAELTYYTRIKNNSIHPSYESYEFNDVELELEHGIKIRIRGNFELQYTSPQIKEEHLKKKIEEKKQEIQDLEKEIKRETCMFKTYSNC